MKTERIVATLALTSLIAIVAGCGQKDQTASTEATTESKTESTLSSVSAAASEAKETAKQAATEVKQTAEKVAADVKQTAQETTAAAGNKIATLKAEAQNLIDKTKTLINDQKYQDALNSLKQLSNLSLTPEQQKTVNDLKAQLEKIMSSQVVTNAASALNGLLKK